MAKTQETVGRGIAGALIGAVPGCLVGEIVTLGAIALFPAIGLPVLAATWLLPPIIGAAAGAGAGAASKE